MSTSEFVHLHVHSQYSMLDGAVKVKNLVKQVQKQGMSAVALTDHGNMFGAISFYKAAKEAGVKAILGAELEVVVSSSRGHGHHLPLLAATEEGYKNLVWLVSRGYVEPDPAGTPGVPCVPLSALEGRTKGLVGLTGCMGGVVAQAVLEEGATAGSKMLGKLKELFEPGSLYVELQDHGLPEQPILKGILVDLAKQAGLPLVATNDVHYGVREDAEAHLYLSCIKTGRSYEEARDRGHGSKEMYLKSAAEMAALFADVPEAITNTLAIADRCALKLKLGEPMLPSFGVPDGMDEASYFKQVAEEGLERRFREFDEIGKKVDRDAYRKRLALEIDVISKMKFPGYFLIVWDFIRFGKENGVPVGPGRGSGAGSLVAYSMRITDLDPIPFNLLFERFLNPERVSMPDFDVDFCMDRRDKVIQYVQQKYGDKSVGQIATFAELKAKSVIKDVARCLAMLPFDAQQIANLIPNKTPAETYTITESLEIEPKLKAKFDTDPKVKELLTQAIKLEGLTRHAGKHAAGIVISEGPLWDHVPVFKDGKSEGYITQYYKDDVEQAGLVKFDFLGLKTLTVIDIAQRLIRARPDQQSKDKPFDIDKVPLDDKAAYVLMASGETKGVFQLESSGMQQLFKDLHPDNFEDIVAAVALYRPGPLGTGMVKDFVDCKHGRKPIAKMHDRVDHLLEPTYGVIVYQEQVMQIAQALAGYSLGGADLLRRAMGKKKPEEMAKQKGIFVEGSKNQGVDEADADRIFGLLEFFAGYGFNKCVIGETSVIDAATGERATVGELYDDRRPFTVHALGDDGRLRPRRVVDVMKNGAKRVFEVRTAQGKRVTATANHPFRTLDGWTNLGDLRVGDRIAAPRRLTVTEGESWPQHELVALAGLLSEGNTCHPSCLYFFGNDRALVDDFARAAARFPESVARIDERADGRLEVCVSTGRDMRFRKGQVPWNAARSLEDGNAALALPPGEPVRSGMFRWAARLGVLGKKAVEKRVPPDVFRLRDADLEIFVGRLWAGDGFLANATQAVPFYATSSEGLARDVQSLLLRLGIQSGVHQKAFAYRGTRRPGFTVHVLGEGSVETFLARVVPHCVGREKQAGLLAAHVARTDRGRTSKDTIPAGVRRWVDEERRKVGLTWSALETQSGVSMKEFLGKGSLRKSGFRRATIAKLAAFFGSTKLRDLAASDVFWDRIVAIEPRGIEETFDLTVEEDHNFVADGLVVHNSHSAAYALITYQTAYLKAHYPVELLCGIMTSDKEKVDKVVRTIADARAMGVTVLPPDVNESDIDFRVIYTHPEGNKKAPRGERTAVARDPCGPQIRFGLGAVRGLGEAALEALLEARKEGGPFADLFDFASRVDAKRINKGVFEALVQCGAFDSTLSARGVTRAEAFASIEIALERSRAASRDRERGQTNMFGLLDASPRGGSGAPSAGGYAKAEAWDRREMLAREQQSLGFYVSGHPLERYLKGGGALQKLEAVSVASLASANAWDVVKVCGMVEGYREKIFRDGGGKIAFFDLEDLSGRVTVKVRSNQIDAYATVLKAGEPVLVTGKVSFPFREADAEAEDEGPREPTLFLNEAVRLADSIRSDTKHVWIRLHEGRATEAHLQKMAEALARSSGSCPVTLILALRDGAEAVIGLGKGFRIEVADEVLSGLERIFGEQVAELR
ncbi:MAG: DNA polymerase III subunit alpha [Labilithrix sp.]|nr:DNA polymerase III subunit alpha [Labilithrix sp.]